MAASCFVAIFAIAGLGFSSFSGLSGLWLGALAAVAFVRPAWGVAILVATVSLDAARPLPGGIVVSFSELQLAVASLALAAAGWSRKQSNPLAYLAREPLLWATPFLAAVLLSSTVNLSWHKVVPHTLRMSEAFWAMALTAGVFGSRQRSRAPFCWALFAAAVALPLLGIWNWSQIRTSSVFTNPNQFAGYLNWALPLAAVQLLQGSFRKRLLWSLPTGLTALALASTASRAGWAAGLAGLAALGLLHRRQIKRPELERAAPSWSSRRVLVFAATVLAVSIGAGFLFRDNLRPTFEYLPTRFTNQDLARASRLRILLLDLGTRMWRDHPWFGVGPANYSKMAKDYFETVEEPYAAHIRRELEQRYRDPGELAAQVEARVEPARRVAATHVHMLYLQLAVNFGPLGLGGFLFFLTLTFRQQRRSAYAGDRLAVAGQAALLAFLIHNLMDVTYPSLGLEMGLFLGATLGLDRPPSGR